MTYWPILLPGVRSRIKMGRILTLVDSRSAQCPLAQARAPLDKIQQLAGIEGGVAAFRAAIPFQCVDPSLFEDQAQPERQVTQHIPVRRSLASLERQIEVLQS